MTPVERLRALAALAPDAPEVITSDGHVWLLFPPKGLSAADSREHFVTFEKAGRALFSAIKGRVYRTDLARADADHRDGDALAAAEAAYAEAERRLAEARELIAPWGEP